MKKIVLAIGTSMMVLSVQAQQEFKTFKPTAGDVTAEFGVSGGLLNSSINLAEGLLLKSRFFIEDKSVIRVGLNINSSVEKENIYRNLTSTDKGVLTEANTGFNLNIGYERHFTGTQRLSPYIGGDILIGLGHNKVEGDRTDGDVYNADYSYYAKSTDFSWGLRGVIGADYYFVKNVYLGVEAGLGFMSTKEGAIKGSTTIDGKTESYEIKSPGSSFNFAPSIVTGVRVGFVF